MPSHSLAPQFAHLKFCSSSTRRLLLSLPSFSNGVFLYFSWLVAFMCCNHFARAGDCGSLIAANIAGLRPRIAILFLRLLSALKVRLLAHVREQKVPGLLCGIPHFGQSFVSTIELLFDSGYRNKGSI
jgi:hypothetical protein